MGGGRKTVFFFFDWSGLLIAVTCKLRLYSMENSDVKQGCGILIWRSMLNNIIKKNNNLVDCKARRRRGGIFMNLKSGELHVVQALATGN